jgi:hypothetical protein
MMLLDVEWSISKLADGFKQFFNHKWDEDPQ